MRKVFMVAVSILVLIGLLVAPACAEVPPVDEYDLTMAVSPVVAPAAGSTAPSGTTSREAGAVIDITATAAEGWEFVNWTAPAGTLANANAAATTFTMPAQDVSVTANFVLVGELELRCTIITDAYGVPHVFAETKEDLAFGAGYAMARDRLWQADVFRRLPAGRLAELGLATIEEDAEMRGLWYGPEELLEMYDNWDPGVGYEHLKDMIEAYTDGVNLYIDEALADQALMPIEYIMQGLVGSLEHFTVADVVAVTVMMAWRFGGTGGNEATFYEALLTLQTMHGATPGGAIWSDLFPLNDAGAPVTIPDAVYELPPLGEFSFELTEDLGGLIEQYEESQARQDALFESVAVPKKFGSNAVPVSGDLSASGDTLQLGGPQMGYSVPQIVYEIGLHGDGINAVGMAFPGAGPFVLIGVSEYGAWTSTTGASDVMDVRVLGLNPAPSDPEVPEYWFDGAWVEMEVRTERIYGPGKTTWEDMTFYRSHYGPIVALDGLQAFTLHTPFYGNEISGEQGWQLFQEATNIDEFEDAVELVWPCHNFLWSGADGNIGYWHAGRFPVKPDGVGADPRLPLMGDGTQEWARVTEAAEMPRSINPDQDWLANWNNKPIADWPFAESDYHWGEGHRVQILMAAMTQFAAMGNLTTAHLNQLNQVGGYHHTAGMSFAGNVTAAALASSNATLQAAGAYLGAWATASPLPVSYVDLVSPAWPYDPNPTYDHPGLTIFDAWYDRIVPKVFSGILPSSLVSRVKSNPSLLIRVFREDASLLYPGYPTGSALNALIIEALEEAVDYLTGQYGGDMSTWLTPVKMQTYDKQGFLPTNVFTHPRMNRGTYNHIAELSTPYPVGQSVIPPGQSGFMQFGVPPVPSPHAYDQVVLYASWTYKPMHLTLGAVEAVETWSIELYG
jgi:penicillin G amidase